MFERERERSSGSIGSFLVWKALTSLPTRGKQNPQRQQTPQGQQTLQRRHTQSHSTDLPSPQYSESIAPLLSRHTTIQSVQTISQPEQLPSQSVTKPYLEEPEFHHLPPRKRRLSATYSTQDDGQTESTCQPFTEEQTQSPLFKLPKEVRLMIYEEVIGGQCLHILRRRNKIGHRVCRGDGDPSNCSPTICHGYKMETGVHISPGDSNILQLLQTCRLIYTEAVFILYTTNLFSFDSLESFLALSCAIPAPRLDSMRAIHLDLRFVAAAFSNECTPHNNPSRWERLWRVLASLVGLRELYTHISWPELLKTPRVVVGILEPLGLVEGLDVFEVLVIGLGRRWPGVVKELERRAKSGRRGGWRLVGEGCGESWKEGKRYRGLG